MSPGDAKVLLGVAEIALVPFPLHYVTLFFRNPGKFIAIWHPSYRQTYADRSRGLSLKEKAYLWAVGLGLALLLAFPIWHFVQWMPHSWRDDEGDGQAPGITGLFSAIGSLALMGGMNAIAGKSVDREKEVSRLERLLEKADEAEQRTRQNQMEPDTLRSEVKKSAAVIADLKQQLRDLEDVSVPAGYLETYLKRGAALAGMSILSAQDLDECEPDKEWLIPADSYDGILTQYTATAQRLLAPAGKRNIPRSDCVDLSQMIKTLQGIIAGPASHYQARRVTITQGSYFDFIAQRADTEISLTAALLYEQTIPGLLSAYFVGIILPTISWEWHGAYERNYSLLMTDRAMVDILEAHFSRKRETPEYHTVLGIPAGFRVMRSSGSLALSCLTWSETEGLVDRAVALSTEGRGEISHERDPGSNRQGPGFLLTC